jgi:hypothetical protein
MILQIVNSFYIQTGAKYKVGRSKNRYHSLSRGKMAGPIWLKIELETARGDLFDVSVAFIEFTSQT